MPHPHDDVKDRDAAPHLHDACEEGVALNKATFNSSHQNASVLYPFGCQRPMCRTSSTWCIVKKEWQGKPNVQAAA
eukprot:c29845_g1_i1 orf=107-334(-)